MQHQRRIVPSIAGERRTLGGYSFTAAIMDVIYLAVLLYFKSIGGYKVRHIDASGREV